MKKLLITTLLSSFAFTAGATDIYGTDYIDVTNPPEFVGLNLRLEAQTEIVFQEVVPREHHDSIYCLAINTYHEARGSSVKDMVATSHVVLNRVKSKKFPDTICSVVWQPKQFSWTWDGASDIPYESQAWLKAQAVAVGTWTGRFKDTTDGADHYHATRINPVWSADFGYDKKIIGQHLYLKVKPKS